MKYIRNILYKLNRYLRVHAIANFTYCINISQLNFSLLLSKFNLMIHAFIFMYNIFLGETRKDVEDLLNHVNSEKLLTDSTYRFNAFIIGLLK